MKKMDYMAPEMETVEMKYSQIVCASGEIVDFGGEGDPDAPLD